MAHHRLCARLRVHVNVLPTHRSRPRNRAFPHRSRFWLSNVVEGLLRSARGDDQLLVVQTGLLEHVLDQLVHDGFHCVGQLQSYFDLLSELVKFSPHVYRRMLLHLGEEKVRGAGPASARMRRAAPDGWNERRGWSVFFVFFFERRPRSYMW